MCCRKLLRSYRNISVAFRFFRCGRLSTSSAFIILLMISANLLLWSFYNSECKGSQVETQQRQRMAQVQQQHAQHQQQQQPRQQQQQRVPIISSLHDIPSAKQCLYNKEKVSKNCHILSNSTNTSKDSGFNMTLLDVWKQESKDFHACLKKVVRDLLLTKNCSNFRHQRGYGRWPVTPEELDFPLAFSFKLHKVPEMFERLLNVLWRPHNLYVVHVDRKAPDEVFQLIKSVADCFDNVVLTETRVDVVYASILSLRADLVAAKEALKSAIPWRYHLGVSGQEFPLKTNLELVQILKALRGANDIENYPPTASKLFMNGLNHKAYIANRVSLINYTEERTPFRYSQVEIRKGSAYNSVRRDFLEWTFQDEECQGLLQWLNHTWAADEVFWATAGFMLDAPGRLGFAIRHDAGTHLSRAVLWQWDPGHCHGQFVRYICIFSALDLPWLLSRPELIANKFDDELDLLVLDCLHSELEERAVRGYNEVMSILSPFQTEPLWRGGEEIAREGGGGEGGVEGIIQGKNESRNLASAPMLTLVRVSSLNWTYYDNLPHVRYRKTDRVEVFHK